MPDLPTDAIDDIEIESAEEKLILASELLEEAHKDLGERGEAGVRVLTGQALGHLERADEMLALRQRDAGRIAARAVDGGQQ